MAEKMNKNKDIQGVNLKTWGKFDSGIDKVSNSKFLKGMVTGATIFLGAWLAAACEITKPPAEIAPLQSGTATKTPFATYTPIVEPTVFPTPTEVITEFEKDKQEIVKNINEFLAAEGQYSDENLADKIFRYEPSGSFVTKGLVKNDLGLLFVAPDYASVQGIDLGAVEGDNCVWIFFGTKMGDDGKREVIPVKMPLEDIEHRFPLEILFYNNRDVFDNVTASAPEHLDDQAISMTTKESVLKAVNSLIGKPIIDDLYYNYSGDLLSDVKYVVSKNGGTEIDVQVVYKLYSEMLGVDSNSFCSFHPIGKSLIKEGQDCGSGYKGVMIDSKVQGFDSNWLGNDNFLSTTMLTTYVDNGK